MSERLFEGTVLLTKCSNGRGKGTRIEFYFGPALDLGEEIVSLDDPELVRGLATAMLEWAASEETARK